MKYTQGKIKREHGIMKEFLPLLRKIEKIEAILRIIPGRISRKQQGTSEFNFTFSYMTPSGLKYMMKKGGTAQEVFLTVQQGDRERVKEEVHTIT